MAEGAVTFLLHKFEKLPHEVRRDLVEMNQELEQMLAFLRLADGMEDGDAQLRLLLKEVGDVAHDIEDIVDEFLLRSKNHHGVLHKIASYPKKAMARLQFSSEIQGIKPRISRAFQRCRSSMLARGLSTTAAESLDTTCFDRRGDAFCFGEAELVGISKPKNKLIGWLLDDDDPSLKVISVVGMGGLGKTTLVKEVFDNMKVRSRFHSRAWISISRSFRIEQLLQDMIYQLFVGADEQPSQVMETMNNDLLATKVKEFLQQNRFLLVLDDIWSIDAWNAVKHALPNNSRGSRVMITTRNAGVAFNASMEPKGKVYTLEPLSDDDSWTLFCRKTFQNESAPRHLETLSRRILRRCRGLPLAIVAISQILWMKDRTRTDEWESLARDLGAEIDSNDTLQSMAKILLIGYNDLPYYLKSCFLYLSIFPEDHPIECMRLIRLWIAEGFVIGTHEKTPEEIASAYLDELLTRSFIQVAGKTNDGRVHSCRIPGVVREIVLSKCRDQNFATIAGEDNTTWPDKIRRLSIHGALENMKAGRTAALRSLFIFGVKDSLSKASIPLLYSGNLRLLKILDLAGASLEKVPDELFRLIFLRYLSLRNTKVKELPSSVGKLQNLETLDLKHTSIDELPPEISKLQQLRHLLVYRYEKESIVRHHYLKAFRAPVGIGGMQSLIKLCFVESNESNNTLKELAGLHHLQRLGITKLRKEEGRALCSSLENMRSLLSLNVHSIQEEEIIDIQHLSGPPPLFLQRLYLHGRLECLPSWISLLHQLVKLHLRRSHLRDNLVKPLGDLPNLVELHLHQAYDGEILSFQDGSFQTMKSLFLDELEEMKVMDVEEGAMPSLELLTISRCDLLEGVPAGIKHLKNLKIIKFLDMPDELKSKILPEDHSGESWNLSHVPEVYFIRWKKSHWERNILSVGHAPKKAGSR